MADCWQPEASLAGSQWIQGTQPCVRSSTLRDLMYAFPKSRYTTGRVTKPRSAGNSPSSAGRRRTSTMPHSSPVCHQHPNQDYQAFLNASLLASVVQRDQGSRPLSWHPAPREPEYLTPQYYPSCTTTTSHNFPVICSQPLQTTAIPCSDGSMPHLFAPNDVQIHHQHFPLAGAQSQFSMQESSFLQASNLQVEPVPWDASATGFPAFGHSVSEDWPFDMGPVNQSVPPLEVPGSHYESVSSLGHLSEPSTPEFLPSQHLGDDFSAHSAPTLEKQSSEDELVGMGLYNNPETFLEGSLHGLHGKGLKLEETFTPSADKDADDDNDAEGDDDQDDDTNETETRVDSSVAIQKWSRPTFEPYKPPNKPAERMMQKSFFFDDHDDDFQQRDIPESRPFLNLGNTCMNYGYAWI